MTLRPAFVTSDRLKLIEKVKNEEPARPRSLDGRIPRDLETIVLKAIEKDPRRRYASAEAMAEDLRRFLADEPIRARHVGAAERYWRWAGAIRRSPCWGRADRRAASSPRSARCSLRGAERSAREAADRAAKAAGERERAERWERYRSNIAEASAAQQLQNSSTGERPLQAAPEEHRNWEWRHLASQLDGASLVLSVPEIDYLPFGSAPTPGRSPPGTFGARSACSTRPPAGPARSCEGTPPP